MLVFKDGAYTRAKRLQEIGILIQRGLAEHGEMPLSGTLFLLQKKYGLTKNKLLEYLEILENLGQFWLDKKRDKIAKTNVE